jgi:hypothetical protein
MVKARRKIAADGELQVARPLKITTTTCALQSASPPCPANAERNGANHAPKE